MDHNDEIDLEVNFKGPKGEPGAKGEKIKVIDCGLFHTIGTMINRGLSISFGKDFLNDGIAISMNRKNVFTRTIISNHDLCVPCLDQAIRNELFDMENKIIKEENKHE